MTDKLKPCPFCGKQPSLYPYGDGTFSISHASSACAFTHSSKKALIAAWNRRAPDARLKAERAVIEAATRQHDWESGCSEHWRPIDDDWSRDYWDEFDPFTRLDDAIRASRRRAN